MVVAIVMVVVMVVVMDVLVGIKLTEVNVVVPPVLSQGMDLHKLMV